jgi:hypothetical protein
MKLLLKFSGLYCIAIMLYACPYSSTHTLDDTPTIYVEDNLVGSWAIFVKKPTNNKQEPVKLILTKKNDTEYDVAFTGSINELKRFRVVEKDTIKGTAFMSTVNGKQFFNIKIKNDNYVAEIILKKGTLSVLPLSEHFTAKMIMSNADLRNSVAFHYHTRVLPMYDDEFCLKEMIKVK